MSETRKDGRIPELDGLRVLMIAVVAWFHIWEQSWVFPDLWHESWLFPTAEAVRNAQRFVWDVSGIQPGLYFVPQTGYIWVDGTILLSVFLLYLPWAKAKRAGTPLPSAGDFYFRRARRVLPAYYFIILCHLLIIALSLRRRVDAGDPCPGIPAVSAAGPGDAEASGMGLPWHAGRLCLLPGVCPVAGGRPENAVQYHTELQHDSQPAGQFPGRIRSRHAGRHGV